MGMIKFENKNKNGGDEKVKYKKQNKNCCNIGMKGKQ